MKEEVPRETTEDSQADDNQQSTSKSASQITKDRKCQYCNQAFTSSSLGRHYDSFLLKKKADGIHDIEEIRRIRSGITRRQARGNTGKRDGSPDDTPKKRSSDSLAASGASAKAKDTPVRLMFNTPTWHATGVINDIPNPSHAQEGPRAVPSQSRAGSLQLPDYASRGATANNPDTMKALELALREVLDNIRAASARFRPRLSPFDFDIQAQTFPSLCLQLLPPPPSLFASQPFPSPASFPLHPPGAEHVDIVRQALRSKIKQWSSDHVGSDATYNTRLAAGDVDAVMVSRTAQQHEELSFRHLELAFSHWNSLPYEARRETWQLEIMRAFARETEKRKSVDEQLARVQQEANRLRYQVERLGSCQWPREFALFPPDTLPLSRDVARELDLKEDPSGPNSERWDYDKVLAKWKRVVMHDKSMGRIGVGYTGSNSPTVESDSGQQRSNTDMRPPRPGEDTSAHPNRLRPLHGPAVMSPDPLNASTPASSTHYASPYSHGNHRSPSGGPATGPQTKRPRLMNGAEGPTHKSITKSPGTWPSSTPILSNLAAPSGQTPPSSRQ